MESQPLSIKELKYAFFSLKINKSPDHDAVSFNVLKKCLCEFCELLKYLFNLSIVNFSWWYKNWKGYSDI